MTRSTFPVESKIQTLSEAFFLCARHHPHGGIPQARRHKQDKRADESLAQPRGIPMLWTIIVILVVLWLLGLIGHVGGSLIHLLLVVAADAFTGFFRLNEVRLGIAVESTA
jgi:hypothetical protein